MEQSFIWYTLQLKAWVKRKSSWLLTIGIFFIILIVSQIYLPSVENISVGVCISDDSYGKKIINILNNMDSVFSFQLYSDSDTLYSDVESGSLECGFVMLKEFEETIRENHLENSITYVCTPLTTKGDVAKETIYTAFLQLYGERILEDSELDIYGKSEAHITQELLEKYNYYLDNSRLLKMNTKMIKVDNVLENQNSGTIYPIHGLVGILLFLMLWIECGRKFENKSSSVYSALDIQRRNVYEYCGYLASITIPAVVTLISTFLFTNHRGMCKEILLLFLWILLTSFWILIVGKLFNKSITFISWALTLVIVQLLLCPVFMDVSTYFPAIKILRWALPLMWYLI